MQNELRTEYPDLPIQIVGINAYGQEVGNPGMTADRTAPLLQDVDANNNGSSDVSLELLNVTYRDVKILNKQNEEVGTVNLTPPRGYDLGEQINYDALKQIITDVAHDRPFWQNADDPTDVNNDQKTSALDALICINKLQSIQDSDGSANLPLPMPPLMPTPYLDVNGDGLVTASDPLRIINRLIDLSSTPEGESIGAELDSPDAEGESVSETDCMSDDPYGERSCSQVAANPPDRLGMTTQLTTQLALTEVSDVWEEFPHDDRRVDTDGSPLESIWKSAFQPGSTLEADSFALAGDAVDSVFQGDDDTLFADSISRSLIDPQPEI